MLDHGWVPDSVSILDTPGKSKTDSNLYCDTEEEDNDSDGNDKGGEGKEDEGAKRFALLLVESFISDDEDAFERLRDFLDNKYFEEIKNREIELTLDAIRCLTTGYDLTEDKHDEIVTKLLEAKVMLMMVKGEDGVNAISKLNRLLGPIVPEPKDEAENEPEQPSQKEGQEQPNNEQTEPAQMEEPENLEVEEASRSKSENHRELDEPSVKSEG